MVNVPTTVEFEQLESVVLSLDNDVAAHEVDITDLYSKLASLEVRVAELEGTQTTVVEKIQAAIVTLNSETPTWSDYFNGTSIDSTKWNILNTDYGTGNGERQCYDVAQVTIKNDSLLLTSSDVDKTYNGKVYPFRSGMVTTRASGGPMRYKRKYGYWEIESKTPHGDAYWPAFWLVGPSDGSTPGWPDYGEFDIGEWIGVRPDIVKQTFHYKAKDGSHQHTSAYNTQNLLNWDSTSIGTQLTASNVNYKGPTESYHKYGFWWEPGLIAWVLDGKVTRYIVADTRKLYVVNSAGTAIEKTTLPEPNVPLRTVFGYEHSIILNLAIGGNMPKNHGYPGDDKVRGDIPSSFDVKYIKVFDNSKHYSDT